MYSEDSEAQCVLCTECTVRSVRHGVCCVRMYSEDSEARCVLYSEDSEAQCVLYSEDSEARYVLCTECTVRTVRHSVCVVQ